MKPLTDADFAVAAEQLGCELAAIRAVADVEAAGSGFLKNGFPRILFESRWFDRLTNGQYRDAYPDLSTERWERNYYGGVREYERLGRALLLARAEAIKATSWGLFQVMGLHCHDLGYASPGQWVQGMLSGERAHLDAMVKFCIFNNLHIAIAERRWTDFARGYNGPAYARNRYDERLAAAYQQHVSEQST